MLSAVILPRFMHLDNCTRHILLNDILFSFFYYNAPFGKPSFCHLSIVGIGALMEK